MSQWKHRIEMAVLLIFVMVSVAAQVRGVVTDSVSRERLPYVSISYNNKGVGHTDNNGDFYVRIPDGCQTLTFSSVGYKSKTVTLEPVDGKKTLNVQLIPDNVMLKEMVVRPRRERYRKKDNPAIVMMRKVSGGQRLLSLSQIREAEYRSRRHQSHIAQQGGVEENAVPA